MGLGDQRENSKSLPRLSIVFLNFSLWSPVEKNENRSWLNELKIREASENPENFSYLHHVEMKWHFMFFIIVVIFTGFLCFSPGSDSSIKFLWIFFPGHLTYSPCYGGPCNTKTNHGKSHKIFNCEFK